jgi:hypothetical protein
MQIIRDTALASNNNAMTLAECDGSLYGTKADIVYDFPLCRQVFKSMKELSPADFVKGLQTYLYEQQYAELKDLVRLRYIESHDEPKAELRPDLLEAVQGRLEYLAALGALDRDLNDRESATLKKLAEISTKLNEALKLLNNPAFTPDEIELEHLSTLVDAGLDEQEELLSDYQSSGQVDKQ